MSAPAVACSRCTSAMRAGLVRRSSADQIALASDAPFRSSSLARPPSSTSGGPRRRRCRSVALGTGREYTDSVRVPMLYTPYFCEENVWQLLGDPRLEGRERYAVFISN